MIEDTERGTAYWAQVGPIWKQVSIYEGAEIVLEQFQRLDPKVASRRSDRILRLSIPS